MELVEFLRARLTEDEETARRAASYDDGAAHDVQGPAGTWTCLDESEWFGSSYRGGMIAPRIGNVNAPELGAHIAQHDPARVLREVGAKRAILDEAFRHAAKIDGEWGCCHDAEEIAAGECEEHQPDDLPIVRLLALPYAAQPDYRPEWAPDA